MIRIRKKGVALVETRKGILVVAGRRKIYSLPGGGADKGESRRKASIRELREETNLKTKSSKYLFSYKGSKWHDHKGRSVRNDAKVFLINAYGNARPKHEIKHVTYWNPKSKIHVSRGSLLLIRKYLESKEEKNV
ncbi:MAG: NUDIX domain-containing protein [Sphaerochaetaceae bacterium]|nr:NUDIX domain-containing protein [Sphaerochaetaceae bacterium]